MQNLIKRLFPVDPNEIDQKNQPDRFIIIISFFCSVAGVVLSGVSIKQPLSPGWMVTKDLIMFGTLITLLLFFYMRYRQVLTNKIRGESALHSQRNSILELIKEKTGIYNALMTNTKNILYSKIEEEIYKYRFDYKTDGLKEHMQKHLSLVMDHLIDIVTNQLKLRDIFDEQLSVSVKALVTSDMVVNLIDNKSHPDLDRIDKNDLYVITLDRDTYTRNFGRREIKKNFYSVRRNTAFQNINNRNRPSIANTLVNNQDFFMNNNLSVLEEMGGYHNQSENWKEFYNATLVVPISREINDPKESGIYGFLTIDCMNKKNIKIFTTEDTLPILLFGAELLALVFLNLDLYDILQSSRNNDVNK